MTQNSETHNHGDRATVETEAAEKAAYNPSAKRTTAGEISARYLGTPLAHIGID